MPGSFQEQRPSPDLRVVNCLFLGSKPRQAGDASNAAADAGAFVDAAGNDYRLKAALPAPGPAPADTVLKVDRAGVPRGERPDKGAFQYRAP